MGLSDFFAVGAMGTATLCGVGCLASLLLALPITMVAVGNYIYLSNKRGPETSINGKDGATLSF